MGCPAVSLFYSHLFPNLSPVITGKYKPERGAEPHSNCQVINGQTNPCANCYTSAVEQKSAFVHCL